MGTASITLERIAPPVQPLASVAVRAPKQNFDALTGLRFFAALGVVLYHFAVPITERGPLFIDHIVSSGFAAVSFFYVLSGFVLSYSYLGSNGRVSASKRSFWAARFARIYPAYLLAFLIAAPFNIVGTLSVNTFHTALAKLFSGAFVVLTMQQAWTPWTAWYWNSPAWSVSVEAFFYLLFPFIAPKLRTLTARNCLWGMFAGWVVALAPPVVLCLTHRFTSGPHPDRLQMAVEFTPLMRLPEFLMGMLLGRIFVRGFRFRPFTAQLLSAGSAAGILAVLAFSSFLPRPLLANGLLAPLFACLIYSLAQGCGPLARFLSLPVLVLLGEASYGIYILQIPVSYVLRTPPPLASSMTLLIYLVALLAVSLLSWRFVENPLRVYLRRLLSANGSSRTGLLIR